MRAARKVGGFAGLVAGGVVAGVYLGATNSDHAMVRYVVSSLNKASEADAPIDPGNAESLLRGAVMLANKTIAPPVLSTVALTKASGGLALSSRVIQPLPVEVDKDGRVSIAFHTTCKTKKFEELSADGRCTLSYVDGENLTCIVFSGKVQRMATEEEAQLKKSWPLFPPLPVLYKTSLHNFTGWRIEPTCVQVVSVPRQLGGDGRDDWKAPEVRREEGDPAWTIVCAGGHGR